MTRAPASARGLGRRLAVPAMIAGALLLAVAVALAVLWRERAAAAEYLLALALPRLGLADARAEVEGVGLRRAVLRNVRLDAADDLTAERIEIDYGWRMLLAGRVARVRIEALTAVVTVDADGVALSGLPAGPGRAPAPAPGIALPPDLPFERLDLERARVRVETDRGPVELSLDGTVTVEAEDRLHASLAASAHHDAGSGSLLIEDAHIGFTHDTVTASLDLAGSGSALGGEARIAGHLDLTLVPDAGTLAARLLLADAAFDIPDLRASGIAGTLAVSIGADGLPLLTTDLSIDSAAFREVQLASARLVGRASPERLDLSLTLESDAGPVAIGVAPVDDTAMGPHRLTLDATLDARTVADLLAPDLSGQGTVSLDLSGRIPFPLDLVVEPAAGIEATELEGRVAFDLAELGSPELGTIERAAGTLAIGVVAGRLAVEATESVTLIGMRVAAGLIDDLPPDLRTALAGPLAIEMEAPFRATLGLVADLLHVEAAGTAHVVAPNAALSVSGAAAVRTGDEPLVTAERVAIRATRIEAQGLTLSGTLDLADVAAGSAETRATLDADLRFAGRPIPEIRQVSGSLTLATEVRLTPGSLELRPALGGRLALDVLRTEEARLTGRTALVLRSASDPIRVDLATAAWTGSLRLRPFTVMAAVDEIGDLAAAVQSLRLDGAGRSLRVRLGEGFAELPELAVQLDGIDADVRLTDGRLVAADLGVDSIQHLAEPAAVLPLRLTVRATESRGSVALRATLQDRPRRILIEADGRHDPRTGIGSIDVRTPTPILFLPHVLQPQQIFPAASGVVTEADGQVDLRARVAWGPGGIESNARISAEFERLVTRTIRVTGLVTDVAFADLLAPRTAGTQRISIDKLDIGIPLEHGVLVFEIAEPNRLTLELERFRLFGGELRAAPVTVALTDPAFESELLVENVDVEQLLAFADYGDLHATGLVRGRIPISFADGRVRIHDGLLESIGDGGIIRYRAPGVDEALDVANDATSLLVNVLRNFLYDHISMEIDELDDGDMHLSLAIKGRSPETAPGAGFSYADLPVELYITITGPIRELLNRELDILDVRGQIERALGGAAP